MGIDNIIIEGDLKVIIGALKSVSNTPWSIQKLKEDTLLLLRDFKEVQMDHIYR